MKSPVQTKELSVTTRVVLSVERRHLEGPGDVPRSIGRYALQGNNRWRLGKVVGDCQSGPHCDAWRRLGRCRRLEGTRKMGVYIDKQFNLHDGYSQTYSVVHLTRITEQLLIIDWFLCRTFCQAAKSRGWQWLVCSTTNPHSPCWTSAPPRCPSMLKAKCTRRRRTTASPCSQLHIGRRFGSYWIRPTENPFGLLEIPPLSLNLYVPCMIPTLVAYGITHLYSVLFET